MQHNDNITNIKALLKKYIENTCTPSEIEILSGIFNDPFQEELLKAAMEELWNVSPEIQLRAEHTQSIRTKIEAAINKDASKRNSFLHYWKVAAAVALLIVSSLLTFEYRDSLFDFMNTTQIVMVHNPSGKRSEIKLPDGTTVWLNAESSLSYPEKFTGKSRNVELSGEAFFDVVRNEHQPFIIKTGKFETTVLGTSFNIKSYQQEEFVVTVATGKVNVKDQKENTVMLKANQQAAYLGHLGFSTSENINVAEAIAWTKGTLIFNNKSFKEVAATLERWYNVKIILANDRLMNCVLMGEHTNQSLDAVLNTLQFILDFEYEHKDGKVIIRGEGCDK